MRRALAVLAIVLCGEAFADQALTINGNAYTTVAHPRILFDGPAGSVTTALKDPDGGGPLVAPKAVLTNPAYVALRAWVDPCVTPNPPGTINDTCGGPMPAMAALDWFMDNSKINSLRAAKYYINNPELDVMNPGFQFAGDPLENNMGLGDWSDWPSFGQYYLALAYTLIQDQLTAGEKATFVKKMFNDTTSAGPENGCTSQLHLVSGAVGSFTIGQTALTGSGLSGLTPGRRIYIRPDSAVISGTYGWAYVQTVNSDSLVTLTAPPVVWSGGNAASISSGRVYEIAPWTDTTCGLSWLMNQFKYVLRLRSLSTVSTTLSGTINASVTSLTVASAAGLPAAPFYINVASATEWMLVTAKVGTTLTVTRAQLYSTAGSHSTGAVVFYTPYAPNLGLLNGNYAQNLTLIKIIGQLAMGLALADESAVARDYVDRFATDWLLQTDLQNRDMWTGFQQGGSSNYGTGRQLAYNAGITMMLKLLTGSPSLDKSDGNRYKNAYYTYLYTSLPYSSSTFMPWGETANATTASSSTMTWAALATGLYGPTLTEEKYWNYFMRSVALFYNSSYLSGHSNQFLVFHSLLHLDETDAAVDYRAVLPTQRTFNTVDGVNAGRGFNSWVSRTGWTSTNDTLVSAQAYALYQGDHVGTGSPASYRIFKVGPMFIEDSSGDTGVGVAGNMAVFGGAANQLATQLVTIDRSQAGASDTYSYVRIDSRGAYATAAAASRALRYLVHFKKTGTQDYVVSYDDLASSSGKTKAINLYYDKTTSQTSTMTDQTTPSLVWTGPTRRLSTAVVLPAGSGVFAAYTSGTNSHKMALCASGDGSTCDATNTAAEFLMVHRPSASASDVMPTVAALGTIDANFRGVQVEGTDPKVAVFAKGGTSRTSTTFTTTHSGTAQILVAGLTPGTYNLFRGATPVCSNVTVDANEALYCESTSGNMSVSAGDPPSDPLIVDATPLTDGTVGTPYSKTFTSTGGTGSGKSWTCTVTCATVLPPGLTLTSGGLLSGTPTLSGAYSFTVQVTDDGANVASRAMSLTINSAAGLTLTGTATVSANSAILTYGGAGLAADATCEVSVTTGGLVSSSYTSPSTGSARRRDVVNGLSPETAYDVRIDCTGSQTLTLSFVTLATVSGDRLLKFGHAPTAALVAQGVAKIEYYIGTSAAAVQTAIGLRSGVVVSCATTCTVTRSAQQGVIYRAWLWTTAGDAIIAQSGITPFPVTGLERPVP